MNNRAVLFVPLIVFAGLALFLMRGLELDPKELPSALIDKPWPAFQLPTLEGKQASAGDLAGAKSLVNVWATWCITCRVEHPFLMDLQRQGVRLIGLNYKDNQADAARWLREKGNPFVFSAIDADGKLGIELGVFGAPETYFVDSRGVIQYKHVGEINQRVWDDSLKAVWQSLK